MRTEAKTTCRGGGKVFTKVAIEGAPAGCAFAIEAKVHGKRCPAMLLPMTSETATTRPDAAQFVAVLPDLGSGSAECVVSAMAGSNTGVANSDPANAASVQFAVDFKKAKWESRLNYRTRAGECASIRDYDRTFEWRMLSVDIREGFPFSDMEDIYRGVVRFPYASESIPEIACYDTQLHKIPAEPVILGSAPYEERPDGTAAMREVQFSLKLPRNPEDVVLTLADPDRPGAASFDVLTAVRRSELQNTTASIRTSAFDDPAYTEWQAAHRARAGELLRQRTARLGTEPAFSIIVPLKRTAPGLLERTVVSIAAQSYANWQLVLVNASPEDSILAERIQEAASRDARITVVTLDEDLGTAGARDVGAAAAAGDFACFMHAGDTLEPDALFEFASAANRHPEADLLYSDEDEIAADGAISRPRFKPDFSIYLLRSFNYIGETFFVRKELLDAIDLGDPAFDGVHSYSTALQAVEAARSVCHVPGALVHRSGSGDEGTLPPAIASAAAVNAVCAHLERAGIDAKVRPSDSGPESCHVDYAVPAEKPLVSIVIPTKDNADVLTACVDSIMNLTTYPNYEIVLVENNSQKDATFECYDRLKSEHGKRVRVRVKRFAGEFNFSAVVNFGASKAKGDYLVFLNNDTELLSPGWLETMLGLCSREDVGAVGARLYYKDGTVQHAGVCVCGRYADHMFWGLPRTDLGCLGLVGKTRDCSAVTAACMMTSRADFDSVGGFDESFAVAFNDVDFCLKLREAGKLVVYSPDVELVHHESLSRGADETPEQKERFEREVSLLRGRWPRYYVEGDPYLNPNLSSAWPRNAYFALKRSWE